MSTFLALVQDLHRECGAAGSAPSAVTGQTGEANRLVNWIIRATYFVDTKWINWKYLRTAWTTANTTSASTPTLSAPSDIKTWDLASFQIVYPGETQRNPVEVVEYEDAKSDILDTNEGPPSRIIIMPDNSLYFDTVPDGVYTIYADYYKAPTKLAANTDVPEMPAEYHDTVILGLAMMYYGNFENAPEIKTAGQELYEPGLEMLENHQLPNQNYSRLRTGGGFEVIAGQDFDDDYSL